MKKVAVTSTVIIFVFFSLMCCQKKATVPEAGSASVDDMLGLVPDSAKGVVFVDVHKAMNTEIAKKTIQRDKDYQKYQEFVKMTGVDPKEDIYYVAVALTETIVTEEDRKTEGAAVINLKYNREDLLPLIREKVADQGQQVQEQDYSGVMIYSVKEEKGNPLFFAFLDDSNIAGGNEAAVKSIIDVWQKKKKDVFQNEALSSLISQTNKQALMWGAILIPAEATQKMAADNPMLSNLEGVTAVAMYFDYKNNNLIAEVKMMSGDETKNQQVVDLLKGLKAMGGMAASEKPEIGELVDKVEISSAPDHVKIYAKIPEILINKLKEMKKAEKEEEE
ncbi:MAG: hypothetical protein ACLFVG_07780 [Candidatus Aminicenantes bacterium]